MIVFRLLACVSLNLSLMRPLSSQKYLTQFNIFDSSIFLVIFLSFQHKESLAERPLKVE